MDEKSARGAFSAPGDLIFAKDGTVWLPVETTLLKDGFLRAWSEGAREWREHAPKGRAAFYPVAEAWATYQPVAFGAGSFQVGFPPEAKLRAAFLAEMNRLTAREVGAKERGLLDALRKQDDPATRNKLGVLYARYGFEDKAREQFSAILAKRATAYALVNMGNLDFVKGNNEKAADYYERAVAADPKSAAALIALARTRYAQEKYAAARELYQKAVAIDQALTDRFAYLAAQGAGSGRASDAASLAGAVIWGE
jgi:tetratricopeptide (TPR) repeat protein